MTGLAYHPHGVLGRYEYSRYINISQFKRGGEGSEERNTEEEINEGRDGRELHDHGIKYRKRLVDTDENIQR
jgi:hypothetical protein